MQRNYGRASKEDPQRDGGGEGPQQPNPLHDGRCGAGASGKKAISGPLQTARLYQKNKEKKPGIQCIKKIGETEPAKMATCTKERICN
eukprot:scaffold72206_cov18-Tisochrysis_lutea.AAC.1